MNPKRADRFGRAGFLAIAMCLGAALTLLTTAPVLADDSVELIPRTPVKKTATERLILEKHSTGRIIVKFVDAAKARATANGGIMSVSNQPLNDASAILQELDLTAESAIKATPEELRSFEIDTERLSGKAQPDFAGMLTINGPRANIQKAARRLNALASIEWVVIEATPTPAYEPGPPLGGCCINDTCVIRDADSCVTSNGFYLGDATICAPGVCVIGACCLPGDMCLETPELHCINVQGGGFEGAGTNCMDAECENDCGEPATGNCWDPAGNNNPFCSDQACCDLICEIDPYCCDEDIPGVWDIFCAAEANWLCDPHTPNWDPMAMPPAPVEDPPLGPDRCATALSGNCFEEHLGGCNNQVCCNAVCAVDPFCCAAQWDNLCIDIAVQVCVGGSFMGPTPDYEPIQGYMTPGPYGMLPAELAPFIPTAGADPFTGYNGIGWGIETPGEPFDDDGYDHTPNTDDLGEGNGWRDPAEEYEDENFNGMYDAGEPFTDSIIENGEWDDGEIFTDDNANFQWDPPGGIRGFADQLLFDENIDATGDGNTTRGEGTKFAVIEWSYWDDHEDLDVTTEPGQRLLQLPLMDRLTNHGTACLGIVSALDNGIGMSGIAPEVDAYFFPLTSEAQGWRELSAWFSAISTLGPGDVISCSYGVPPGNLNTVQSTWTMIRAAADRGITVCIAAANSCFNLDEADDFGDSGGIVVGACSPGSPHYRLSFSNYCTDPDIARGNVVHVKAWGDAVATLGYGALPLPFGDMNRSYTAAFGGTSAAAPQIAGLAVAIQGLAKQFYGIPLPSTSVRSLMGPFGEPVGPPQRVLINGGFSDDQACGLDLDPEEGPNIAGNYPNTTQVFNTLISQNVGFSDSPLVDDVVVIRGLNVSGNKFSIMGDDQFYLGIDGQYTDRDHTPGRGQMGQGGGSNPALTVPEISSARYLAGGEITDIVVIAHTDLPATNTLILEAQVAWPNVYTLAFVEAYDWRENRWLFTNLSMNGDDRVATQDPSNDFIFEWATDAPDRYRRLSDGRLLLRIWTIGFIAPDGGFGGSGDDFYRMRYDLLNVFASDIGGEQLP